MIPGLYYFLPHDEPIILLATVSRVWVRFSAASGVALDMAALRIADARSIGTFVRAGIDRDWFKGRKQTPGFGFEDIAGLPPLCRDKAGLFQPYYEDNAFTGVHGWRGHKRNTDYEKNTRDSAQLTIVHWYHTRRGGQPGVEPKPNASDQCHRPEALLCDRQSAVALGDGSVNVEYPDQRNGSGEHQP